MVQIIKATALRKRARRTLSGRAAGSTATPGDVGDRNKIDTEMRRLDQALTRLNGALAKRIAAEVAALGEADRELRSETVQRQRGVARVRQLECQMLRDEVFAAIVRITAALAHELNQPLAAACFLVKAADLRLAREASEDINAARDDLDEAATQILQVGRIIRRLLDRFANRSDR